ncbi:MAG TPA: hypothetical protein VE891_13250 [Allosphingosinicella sp.]|nr:hypothetical protein [Allosphingosinicella sp.]
MRRSLAGLAPAAVEHRGARRDGEQDEQDGIRRFIEGRTTMTAF